MLNWQQNQTNTEATKWLILKKCILIKYIFSQQHFVFYLFIFDKKASVICYWNLMFLSVETFLMDSILKSD